MAGKDLGIGPEAKGFRLPGLEVIGTQTMKLFLLLQGGLKPFAFLGKHMQQDRSLLGLQKLESFDQRRDVMAVNRTVVLQAQFFKNHARPEHALGSFFRLPGHQQRLFAAHLLDESSRLFMQMIVLRIGDDLMKITGDRAYVLIDGPLIVIQHNQHPPSVMRNIVEGLIGDAAGKSGVASQGHHVFCATHTITGNRHSECR